MSAARTIVFAGDSITDCGRLADPEWLGTGYVRTLAASDALASWRVLNRGISGNRTRDLQERWNSDVLSEAPDAVSAEPFLIPATPEQARWAEDLDPKREAIRLVAAEFSAVFVPLHEPLNDLARRTGAPMIAPDGVHPSMTGHHAIAGLWEQAVSGATQ